MKNAFALLVMFVALCIVGKLDYADEVITENERLRAQAQTAQIRCSTANHTYARK